MIFGRLYMAVKVDLLFLSSDFSKLPKFETYSDYTI
jgi:hypothetical protein